MLLEYHSKARMGRMGASAATELLASFELNETIRVMIMDHEDPPCSTLFAAVWLSSVYSSAAWNDSRGIENEEGSKMQRF
jgi:hypothetical protein